MEFTDLAFSPMCRMNEVYRYSSVYQENLESLSDHVVDVMMMSYLIVNDLTMKTSETFDVGLLLEKCLLHDIDEVITGDIPRNTKYATKEAREQLNVVAEKAIKMLSEDASSDVHNLYNSWKTAKEGKEGLVLSISDMLSVAKKSITEINLRGNLTFLKVITELDCHLSKMMKELSSTNIINDDSKSYLIELISSAQSEVKFIKMKYSFYIDKYHIKENIIEWEDY